MAEKYGKKAKELMIKEMKEVFSGSEGFVLSSFEKVKATEMGVLRRKLKQSGSAYFVIKNRLGKIVLDEAGLSEFTGILEQKTAIGVGIIKEDPVKVAKVMADFAKANKGFEIASGYLEGRLLTPEKIKELSQLPGREQLIAMVLSALNGPVSGFVGVLSSILRSLCYAINSIKEKKEKEG
ncbi:MAG: 50S ribosomal protein L10 [Candidatus Omnitrophota bacterium]